ncbi:MAG: hypothetical protein VX460_01565 [Planctomycetota bacterium]|nr:hypothetical protein [Planctomycetota bacterium]
MASQRGNSNGPLLALLAAAVLSAAVGLLVIEPGPRPGPDAPGSRPAVSPPPADGAGAALLPPPGGPEVAVEGSGKTVPARTAGAPEGAAGDCLLRAVDALTGEPVPAASARLTGFRDLSAPQPTLLPGAPGEPIVVHYAGQALLVQIAAPGYVSAELTVEGPGPRRVALERTTSLVGVVVIGANGNPSSGARVTVRAAADVDGGLLLIGRTDEGGRVILGPLGTGDYSVRVASSEGSADPTPITVGVEPASLEIRLAHD